MSNIINKQRKYGFFFSFFRVSQYLGQRIPLFNTVKVSSCLCSGDEASRRGGGGGGLQLEVSEWTLPGPSVGDVTDEGVGASCQPPFVCEGETGRRVRAFGWKIEQIGPKRAFAILNTLRKAQVCSLTIVS